MNADVIVTLGAGVEPDGTLPELPRLRVEEAVELWKGKSAPNMLMSGAWGMETPAPATPSEAAAMKADAVKYGVDPSVISLEAESRDTIGNAYFSKVNFLVPRNWRKVIIVTSDYHVPRAEYIFKHVLGEEFEIAMAPSKSNLSEEEREEKTHYEAKLLKFTELWLKLISPGNDVKLLELLLHEHPAYSNNPKFTHEELQQKIAEM